MKYASEKVLEVIFQSVDAVNRLLAPEKQLKKSVDTPLTGSAADLDSLGLVSLVLLTEEHVRAEFGLTIDLADRRAVSEQVNPYRTIGTLCDYVVRLLNEKSND